MAKKEESIDIKNLKVRKKLLRNRSRKGWYYYIKEKGKRPAYYKIKEGLTLDNYLMAYEGKVKVKKKGVIEYNKERPAEEYLRKVVKNKRSIEKLISKGITVIGWLKIEWHVPGILKPRIIKTTPENIK